MKTKILLMLVLVAFAAAGLTGCSLLKKRVEKREKAEYKLNGKNKSKISIENIKGEIRISQTADTLGLITIQAEKVAKVKYDERDNPITNIKINIDSSNNEIKITTEFKDSQREMFDHSEHNWVNYDVKVPANIKVDVDNTNGSVVLTRINDDIKVETVNGAVVLNKCTGNIVVNGVNGMVSGNFDSLKSLNIDVVNGAIRLGGLKNVSAQVNASTTNGKIKFNSLNFQNLAFEKRNLTGTLGSGQYMIKTTSINGKITLDANDIILAKNRHDDFNFSFEFDGDDDIPTKKLKDSAKTLEAPKVPDTSKTPVAPKSR